MNKKDVTKTWMGKLGGNVYAIDFQSDYFGTTLNFAFTGSQMVVDAYDLADFKMAKDQLRKFANDICDALDYFESTKGNLEQEEETDKKPKKKAKKASV